MNKWADILSIDKLKKDEQIRVKCHFFSICGFIHSIKAYSYTLGGIMDQDLEFSELTDWFFLPALIVIIEHPILEYYRNRFKSNLLIKYIGIRYYRRCNDEIMISTYGSNNNINFSEMYMTGVSPIAVLKNGMLLPSRNELMNLLHNLTEKLSKNTLNKVKKYL